MLIKRRMNKKGAFPIVAVLWGGAALLAGAGYLFRGVGGGGGGGMPMWGWIVIALMILVLLRR